jgi:uncharacterized membrane protein YdjX (TVP38/TMEM64 family)
MRLADARRHLGGTRAAAVVAAVLIVVALSASAALHDLLVRVFAAAGSYFAAYPRAGMAAFVGLAALSALLAFFSSAPLVPVGVVTWGSPTTAVLLALGWTLGGVMGYAAARWLGRAVLVRFVAVDVLAPYERRLRRDTPFGLALLFQLALPSEIPGVVLGLARYSLPKYLAILALVEGPYAVATVWLGREFVARRVWPFLLVGAVIVGVGVVAMAAFRRRLAEHPPEDDIGTTARD